MALTETVEGGVELSLPHQSLGDTYIELISEVVKDLPGVTRLDLRDNRLTDVGVQEIVEAICSMDGHRGIQVHFSKHNYNRARALSPGMAKEVCRRMSLGSKHPFQSIFFNGECRRAPGL